MKTLYITDLDGTLLNDQGVVSKASSQVISHLSRKGALISVATARTPASVEVLLADTYTTADLVVMTGAALWNRDRHCFDGLCLLSEADVHTLLDCFAGSGVHPFCYALETERTLEVFHHPRLTEPELGFVEQRKKLLLKHFTFTHFMPLKAYGRMVLFFAMGSYESIVAVAKKASDATTCYVSYYKDTYTPDLWLLEIFAHGVSKANGIARLKEATNADRVVVFGDNLNDIPMFRGVDLAVAVDNALDQVKEAADIVIGNNNRDAVARFIAIDFINHSY